MNDQTLRRLQFVLGKGGVGKSTVACALARYYSERQKSVLLVQIRASDSHAAILGIPKVKGTIAQVGPYLSTINLDPLLCLKEYLKLKAPFLLTDFLFRPSVLATVVNFVPGIAELVMMGKITYQLEEKNQNNDSPRFDCIIVDMPATGHAIKMLQVAKSTQNLVKKGTLAADTAHMQALISDQSLSCVHLVTLLEDMPAQEILEAVTDLKSSGWNNFGTLFVNRMKTRRKNQSPTTPPDTQANETFKSVRELWAEEEQKENRWLNELSRSLSFMPIQIFPDVLSLDFELEQLEQLIGEMT